MICMTRIRELSALLSLFLGGIVMKHKLNDFQIGIVLIGISSICTLVGIDFIIHGVVANDRILKELVILNSAGKTDSIMK